MTIRKRAVGFACMPLLALGLAGYHATAQASPNAHAAAHVRPAPTPTATATAVDNTTPDTPGAQPYAPALAGQSLVTSWDAATIASAPWSDPTNNPGNCRANPSQIHLNAAGYAELDTTGSAGNCTALESPSALPAQPGYTYEYKLLEANSDEHSASWMFNNNWPTQGEVDATEFEFGTSYASFHYAPCNSQTSSSELSTDPWTYDCKTTVAASGPDYTSGAWHIVDVAFNSDGVAVYYDGQLYVQFNEPVTAASANDVMNLTFSEGACRIHGDNECAAGALGTPGSMQVAYAAEYQG